jgi:hypothetical protein
MKKRNMNKDKNEIIEINIFMLFKMGACFSLENKDEYGLNDKTFTNTKIFNLIDNKTC